MAEYEKIKCNLCGSDDYKIIHNALPETEGLSLRDKFAASSAEVCTEQIVRCNSCGLVYVNPRMVPETIIQGYSEADNKTYAEEGKQRIETFKEGIKLIEKYTKGKKGKVLDVGCAAGFFLVAARDSGWDVNGVEPSGWFKTFAKDTYGLNITAKELKNAGFSPETFDVITFWDVLEHVPDPKADLKAAHSLLKKGGILLINYPAYDSIWAKLLGRKWWFLLSVHLYYFTKKSLDRYLKEMGFEPLSFKMHWQKLSLGYLVFRLKPYSNIVYKLGNFFVKLLRIEKFKIRYYASQVNVIAKKI